MRLTCSCRLLDALWLLNVQRADLPAAPFLSSKQLDTAIVSARKARRKKWICFWIVVIILIIVAAVVAGVVVSQKSVLRNPFCSVCLPPADIALAALFVALPTE